ncbi:hypothetical protein D3C85_527950 [compost metagenome]
MPMVLLCLDHDAMEKVHHEAIAQDVHFDVMLSQQFNEFLIERQYRPAPPVAIAAPVSVDSRDELLDKILETASKIEGPFVFNDVIALVPELAEMPKQDTTKYASLFARKHADNDSGIVKLGKNSSKATEYAVKRDA